MNEPQDKKKNEMEMLLDYVDVPVKFRAQPNTEPVTGSVRIQKIPICDMEPLGRAFGKYLNEVMCYTGKDEAFVRSLTDESFGEVLEKGRQLNFTSFKKWWAWQDQTLEALGQSEAKDDLVARVVAKLADQQRPAAKASPASP